MSRDPSSIDEYKHLVATYIRQKEADMCRGQLERLNELERVSDDELLRKWAWMSAIAGAAASFLAGPLILTVLARLLPPLLLLFFWAVVKVAMAASLSMFALAFYLTRQMSSH